MGEFRPFLLSTSRICFTLSQPFVHFMFQTLHERAVKARLAKKKAPLPTKPKIQEPAAGMSWWTTNVIH